MVALAWPWPEQAVGVEGLRLERSALLLACIRPVVGLVRWVGCRLLAAGRLGGVLVRQARVHGSLPVQAARSEQPAAGLGPGLAPERLGLALAR